MKLRLWLCVVTGLAFLAAPVRAEDEEKKTEEKPNPAVEILKKADAATKAVSLVRYDAVAEITGPAAARAPKVSGGVTLGAPNGDVPRFHINAHVKRPGSEDAFDCVAGCDGENFYLIDPVEKIAYVDLDQEVMGQKGREAAEMVMIEFGHPTPFQDEINADVAELLGTEKIGDTECNKIHVLYTGGRGESIWYFGKEDSLPRRVDRIFKRPDTGETNEKHIIISKLDVNPSFLVDPFKFVVPEGFEKSDDFAP